MERIVWISLSLEFSSWRRHHDLFLPSITASMSDVECQHWGNSLGYPLSSPNYRRPTPGCIIKLFGHPLGIFYPISKSLEISLSAVILYAFPATTALIVLSKASLIASDVFLGEMVTKKFSPVHTHWTNINKSYYENILIFKNHNFSGTTILFCRKKPG